MRLLLIAAVVFSSAYGVWRITPPDQKERAANAVKSARLFNETLPGFLNKTLPEYLRKKFTIPESGAKKRERLLTELAGNFDSLAREIETQSQSAQALPKSIPGATAARSSAAKAKKLMQESDEKLSELKKINAEKGFFSNATARAIDAIFPVEKPATEAEACAP